MLFDAPPTTTNQIYPLPTTNHGVQRVPTDTLAKLATRGVEKLSVQRTTDTAALTALAALRHRETMHFDPLTGQPLSFDSYGAATVHHDQSVTEIFPRIDPAVIGLITLAGTDQILLGKNAHHQYYSLIAGYVDIGETFEAAMKREAREEAGRNIYNLRYQRSQPWPYSGSIMVGFTATTDDPDPIMPTDGELTETRWVTRTQLRTSSLPLPGAGSLATVLINEWLHQ